VSNARGVAVLVAALAMCVAGQAAELHESELEGCLAPPASLRVEASASDPSPSPALASYRGPRPAVATTLQAGLSLVWIDAAGAAAGSERSARDESLQLLRAMGVDATWRKGSPNETAQPGEVRVILLDRAAVDAAGSPVLGSTPARFDGEPFFWVHVPSVRGALGMDARRALGPADLRDRHLLGVALGRVIAHETVHAVAPGVPHGAGLMSPRLKKGDLTSKTVAVPAELGLAVRMSLADGAPPLPAGEVTGTRLLTAGPEMPR